MWLLANWEWGVTQVWMSGGVRATAEGNFSESARGRKVSYFWECVLEMWCFTEILENFICIRGWECVQFHWWGQWWTRSLTPLLSGLFSVLILSHVLINNFPCKFSKIPFLHLKDNYPEDYRILCALQMSPRHGCLGRGGCKFSPNHWVTSTGLLCELTDCGVTIHDLMWRNAAEHHI